MSIAKSPEILLVGIGKTAATLVEKLRSKKVQHRVLVRSERQAEELSGPYTDVVPFFDYGDPATYTNSFKGIRKLYSVSADVAQGQFYETTEQFLALARKHGVETVVRMSLFRCDDSSQGFGATEYGRQHLLVERLIQKLGFTYTFLRTTWFMQNLFDYHATEIFVHDALVVPHGLEGRLNSVDARDIAEIAAIALTEDGHSNKTYELTGPQTLEMDEVRRLLSNMLDRSIELIDFPLSDSREWMAVSGADKQAARTLNALYNESRLGNTSEVTDVVQSILKRPAISLVQHVSDMLADTASQEPEKVRDRLPKLKQKT